MDFTIGIILRNLASTSNFVEYQDNLNFMFFEAQRVVRDTWRIGMAQYETRVKWRASQTWAQVGPIRDMWQYVIGEKYKVDG